MTATSTDCWLNTSEQFQEAPRPFWHRGLFYQRPDTSKSLAEEPWAREVHMDDLKAWKIAEASQCSSFLRQQQAASWFPTSFPLTSLRAAKAEEVMGSAEPGTTPESVGQIWMLVMGPWFYASSLQLFGGLPIFCIKFLSPRNHHIFLTNPSPIGSACNAWFTDAKPGHAKIVNCLRSGKEAAR